jgi:hypothetical protein
MRLVRGGKDAGSDLVFWADEVVCRAIRSYSRDFDRSQPVASAAARSTFQKTVRAMALEMEYGFSMKIKLLSIGSSRVRREASTWELL